MIWLAVLGGSAAAFILKLAGYLVPERWLSSPFMRRITLLIPVSLLAALTVVQTFETSEGTLAIDARLVGLGVAFIALALRAPLLLAIIGAAASAAVVRWLGWLP